MRSAGGKGCELLRQRCGLRWLFRFWRRCGGNLSLCRLRRRCQLCLRQLRRRCYGDLPLRQRCGWGRCFDAQGRDTARGFDRCRRGVIGGVGLRYLVSDLFRAEQEHDSGGDHRGNGADGAQPQHHRPMIRGPGRRLWNKLRLQRTLMPGPIVTETPAFRIALSPLLERCSAALPQRCAELVPRHLLTRCRFTRRRLARGLLACSLFAWPLLACRLLTHPWRRVFEFGPYRIAVIRRGHDLPSRVQRWSAASSFTSLLPNGAHGPAIVKTCETSLLDRHRSQASLADCSGRSRTRCAAAASAAARAASAATAALPR